MPTPNEVLQATRQLYRKEKVVQRKWKERWSWWEVEQQKIQEKTGNVFKEHQCCLVDINDKFFNPKIHAFKKTYEVDYQLPKPYPVTTNQVYGRLPRYECDKHELYKFH